MKSNNENMKNNILALAVQGALMAMFALPLVAQAEDAVSDEAAALTRPTNTIEVGAANVSNESAKFGEYNGLDENGLYGIANINLNGGNAYDGGDGTMRWQVKGVDLGTTSREIGASVSNQGQWNIGVNFDQLRHNLSDSYQTPYQGSMGGNNFTLPASFGVAPGNNTNTLNNAQKAAFHNEDIHTTRENTSLTAGYTFNPQWDVKLDFNHLNQTGAKLMAFSAMAQPAAAPLAAAGRSLSILPNPTNYTTDTVDLALHWAGDKAHVTASYFGSFFRDDYDRVTFETFAGSQRTQTMSTAPDNDFHQLSLLGGYTFTDKTKLAGGLSYGRATQDDKFVVDPFMLNPVGAALPRSSADAKVINTHADLKLTDQSINKLTLTAGFKYDERDNKTPSNFYNFEGVSGAGADTARYPTTPYSNRKTQYELAGDYRLDNKQHVRLAYNRDNVQRWCNDYGVGGVANYAAGTQCVVATSSKEDKLSVNYKLNATEDVHLNAGYSYADRNTHFNPLARVGMIQSITVGGVTATGLNGGDFVGFHPFFDADRKQQLVKAGVDWQANDKLSLTLSGRYTDDNYDTQYGFQNGNTWSLNLDANYSYSEKGSINAYVTQEHRERELTNLQTLNAVAANATRVAVPAGGTWTNTLDDDDITFGLGAKQGGLMGGKLELAADFTYSLGKTAQDTQLNYNTTTTGGLTCGAPGILTCGSLPDIKNRMAQFKLNGDYKVSKAGTIGLGYLYQKLTSTDYYYNALQQGSSAALGTTPALLMPTNQDSGSYSVNVVTATYIHTF